MSTAKERERLERDNAMAFLRKHVASGMKVYTIAEHANSNMTHWIRLFIVDADGELIEITWAAKHALGCRFQNHKGRYGLVYGGCGYDPAHSAVYDLGRELFPDYKRDSKKGEPYALRQERIHG